MSFSGYIRVSAKAGRNGESFISPDVQRETIERLCAANGLTLAGDPVEEIDVSGGKPIEERRLGELVRAVEAGESEGIIVWKLTRFSRSLLDGVTVASRVMDAGGRILASDFDSRNPTAKALLGLLMGLAEEELDQRREGFAQARSRAVKRGAFPAETPYGYRREGKGAPLVPDHGERTAAVRAIFRMADEGLTLAEIAPRVAEITPAPRGGTWTHSTIRQILRNRAYIGEQRHGSDVNERAHEALVSEAQWLRVQSVKPVPKVNPHDRSASTLLGGRGSLLRCAGCGHALRFLKASRPSLRDCYYCYQPSNGSACPARGSVPVAELDAYVESWFLGWIRGNVRVASGKRVERRALETARAVEDAEAELAAYLEKTSALGADFLPSYESRKAKLELLKLEAASAENERRPYADLPRGDLLAAWPTLPMRRKRQLLAAFVDEIRVSKGRGLIAERVQFVRDGVVLPEDVREVIAQNA